MMLLLVTRSQAYKGREVVVCMLVHLLSSMQLVTVTLPFHVVFEQGVHDLCVKLECTVLAIMRTLTDEKLHLQKQSTGLLRQ